MGRPRIAIVTSLFPLRAEPYRGKPIYETALALREWAEVEVFCPMAVYPGLLQPRSYQFRRADKDYSPPGIRVNYFDYWTLPVVGRILNGPSAARVIMSALERYRPDLVLNYWVYPDGYAALRAARKLGVPVVTGARGSDLLRIPDRTTEKRISFTLRHADAVLAVSEELRRRAVSLGAPAGRVSVILNGCDTDIFHPQDRAGARQSLGLPAKGPVVLYVGHLIPSKGLFELAAFKARHADVNVVCVGEGSLKDVLVQRGLTAPGSATSVQIALWLAAADVFCLPSYSEGCPNVVLEALSCGRPVVGTTVGAIPDLIRPTSGILVPPRDAAAVTQALERALGSPWDTASISSQFSRSWRDAAYDTFGVCSSLLRS